MWLRSKNIALMAALSIILMGCGFEPMYGSSTHGSYGQQATEDQLSTVFIANIPDRDGQYLRNALIDTITPHGVPIYPKYELTLSPLNERKIDLDVTIESETTRAQLQISTTMTLRNKESGETLLSRSLYAANSYNVLGSQFTTIVSRDDARTAILDDLARQAQTQLSLYFQR